MPPAERAVPGVREVVEAADDRVVVPDQHLRVDAADPQPHPPRIPVGQVAQQRRRRAPLRGRPAVRHGHLDPAPQAPVQRFGHAPVQHLVADLVGGDHEAALGHPQRAPQQLAVLAVLHDHCRGEGTPGEPPPQPVRVLRPGQRPGSYGAARPFFRVLSRKRVGRRHGRRERVGRHGRDPVLVVLVGGVRELVALLEHHPAERPFGDGRPDPAEQVAHGLAGPAAGRGQQEADLVVVAAGAERVPARDQRSAVVADDDLRVRARRHPRHQRGRAAPLPGQAVDRRLHLDVQPGAVRDAPDEDDLDAALHGAAQPGLHRLQRGVSHPRNGDDDLGPGVVDEIGQDRGVLGRADHDPVLDLPVGAVIEHGRDTPGVVGQLQVLGAALGGGDTFEPGDVVGERADRLLDRRGVARPLARDLAELPAQAVVGVIRHDPGEAGRGEAPARGREVPVHHGDDHRAGVRVELGAYVQRVPASPGVRPLVLLQGADGEDVPGAASAAPGRGDLGRRLALAAPVAVVPAAQPCVDRVQQLRARRRAERDVGPGLVDREPRLAWGAWAGARHHVAGEPFDHQLDRVLLRLRAGQVAQETAGQPPPDPRRQVDRAVREVDREVAVPPQVVDQVEGHPAAEAEQGGHVVDAGRPAAVAVGQRGDDTQDAFLHRRQAVAETGAHADTPHVARHVDGDGRPGTVAHAPITSPAGMTEP